MNQGLSTFLNISRWLAAFMVLIDHVRHLILVEIDQVEHKTILWKVLYFATGFGNEAVMVFFVISGFLVGALTLERWRTKGANLRAYISARVSRIYTVFIPALIVGFVIDCIGLHYFNDSELYSNSKVYAITSQISSWDFIGNLFMMQGILVEHFGSNRPLWSLANEWWYYCIFALIGMAITSKGNPRIGLIVAAIVFASLLPFKILILGGVWLLGFGVHAWINSRLWRPHPLFGIGIFLILIIVSRLGHNVLNDTVSAFSVGIGYVFALVSSSRTNILPLKRVNAFLAEFSYTTYLFHFPAMLFIVAANYQVFGLKFQVQPSAYGWFYIAGLALVLYLYCFVFSLLTERHTDFVRNKLSLYMGLKTDKFK